MDAMIKEFLKTRLFGLEGQGQFAASGPAALLRKAFFMADDWRRDLPSSEDRMRASALFQSWWYYTIELMPGLFTQGIFPRDLPMVPRLMLRRCDLEGAKCLDLGSMEGLLPVLMKRQGARSVLATDASFHCYKKLTAVQKIYGEPFDFKQIGSMYELSRKLRRAGGFDFINLSGVLYHVFSPMHVLAGVRPLLKRNGLMMVSTNIVLREDFSMEFNNAGKLQTENNTFWYPSVALFDYLLRYFRLAPVDALAYRYPREDGVRFNADFDVAYVSVLCRATDEPAVPATDGWTRDSAISSWEMQFLGDEAMLKAQPLSSIRTRAAVEDDGRENLSVAQLIARNGYVSRAARRQDTHALALSDFE